MDSTIIGSIIGIGGMLVGITIAEIVRRRSRVEKFSETYFIKKVEISEELFSQFLDITNLYGELILSKEPAEKKRERWQPEVLALLSWCDKKFLFLGEELTVHIGMVLIGAGETLNDDMNKGDEIMQDFKETKLLIKESLGFTFIEKKFNRISGSKTESGHINTYLKMKKEFEDMSN